MVPTASVTTFHFCPQSFGQTQITNYTGAHGTCMVDAFGKSSDQRPHRAVQKAQL